jgi:hypothetical protein
MAGEMGGDGLEALTGGLEGGRIDIPLSELHQREIVVSGLHVGSSFVLRPETAGNRGREVQLESEHVFDTLPA